MTTTRVRTASLKVALGTFCVMATSGGVGLEGAAAQRSTDRAEENSVLDRARPNYDAVGVPAGGFTFFPGLRISAGHDDNLFATSALEVDDMFLGVGLDMALKSNWSRHHLAFDGWTQTKFHDETTDEDQVEWGLGVKARMDAARASLINVEARFDTLMENRGSLDAGALAAEPAEYSVATGALSFTQRVNRISFALGARRTSYDYDDTDALGGGIIEQDDRDNTQDMLIGTAKYEFSPGNSFVMEGRLNNRDYDLEAGDTGFVPGVDFNRDSSGHTIGAGFEFGLTNLVNGKILIGYLEQDYDDPAFTSVDGAMFSAALKWSLSGLTDLRFKGGRMVEDSTSAAAGGRLATSYSAAIDHELMRNVIVTVEAGQTEYDYDGLPREDTMVRAGAGVKYLVNRRMALDLGYEYSERTSSVVGAEYARQVIQLSYRLQL